LTPEQQRRAEEIERLSRRRRTMLVAHQVFGFATLAALAATLVVGQLVYDDKYARGDDNGRFNDAHLGLSIVATGLFATTGVLGLFAPNPYPKPIKLDTALVHKLSMLAAAIGMVAQIVLGPVAAAREGKLDQRDYAVAHLVAGYATFGFMAAGTLAYVF
jgi:hypothetical protein